MRDGTFTATVSFGDKIADNGIVFLSDDEERVFYFFERNLVGQYVLVKNDDGFVSTLKTASSSNTDDVVTLSVIIDDKEKTIDTYINDEFLFQVEENLSSLVIASVSRRAGKGHPMKTSRLSRIRIHS